MRLIELGSVSDNWFCLEELNSGIIWDPVRSVLDNTDCIVNDIPNYNIRSGKNLFKKFIPSIEI